MNNVKIPKDIIPTLIIGLGGTGFQVVKRLKSLFANRYGNKKLPIRYLIIDTDLKSFLDDSIDNNERCQLRFGDGVKNTLDWAYGNPSFNWLPKNPKLTPDFFTSTDQGAGLMRPIGRLYLCKNAKLVYDTLNTAKSDLVDLYKMLIDNKEIGMEESYLDNIGKQKVYLVGSLAGGTGCGTFLDISVMLSKIFNRDNTNVIGMFTLESCYDDKLSSDLDAQNRSKANCYAALKELEFYMSSITNEYDEKYTFNYLNVGEITLNKKLLDICYVIEKKNEDGGELNNVEDIYDLCSLQLFQEIGTKLGSQLRADYANFISKDKDPILNRERHFSSFASSSMEVPIESLKRYCVDKLAQDILDKLTKCNNEKKINIKNKVREIVKDINIELRTEEFLEDFTIDYEIRNSLKYSELKIKIDDMQEIKDIAYSKLQGWRENLDKKQEKIKGVINKHINESSVKIGLNRFKEVLEEIKRGFNDFDSISKENDEVILSAFEKVNKTTGFFRKKETTIEKNQKVIFEFNSYITTIYKNFINNLKEDTYYKVRKIVDNEIDNIDSIIGNLDVNSLSDRLNRISYQAKKRYGGNIISREMVSMGFYENYYNTKFVKNLGNKLSSMFNKISILEFLKERQEQIVRNGQDILINICEKEFDKLNSNVNIIEILKENAKLEGIEFNEYVRQQLEITAKLTKPFWSAQKNPELSWTECYYIGAVRDEGITNGFTEKPEESIDRWIRNQNGERAKQAKYVETTNPYSIDVIHIIMGACASYLPEIKSYKQFYLKLLASKTYPLHLNEKYIGFDELDYDTHNLLEFYSLALVYGAIIKIEDNYMLNLDKQSKYLYDFKYCLNKEELEDEEVASEKILDNKSDLKEKYRLGKSEKEVIDRLIIDSELNRTIKSFLREVENNFSKEFLEEHKNNYIENELIDRSLIALEKLRYKTSLK